MSAKNHPNIGDPYEGGFYGGQIQISGKDYALIVAPKAAGEHDDAPWNNGMKPVDAALAYDDGLANTQAMATAGSKLAKWALGLSIDGHDDWYLPSQDELETLYRNLKPTEDGNWCFARSGINLSTLPPTRPYTPELPQQTAVELFRTGAAEAFDGVWYWSSTQRAADPDYAWAQRFGFGTQGFSHKSLKLRARAVRRSAI